MEIKQLKFFVVAADVGSFSEAAKVLYTTQSSVSKVILSLEKELGYNLFKRENKGIVLTQEGQQFHSKASSIVADFENLENESMANQKNMVKIGSNHSSWLANCFSEFYEINKAGDACYRIHADTTPNIVKRLHLMEDEVGFVYIFPDARMQFDYEVKKFNLEYVELRAVDGMLYYKPDGVDTKEKTTDIIHNLKYIQSERDEYLKDGLWYTEKGQVVDINENVAVITNSDYVMHALLKNNSLANISADSFNNLRSGVGIKHKDGNISFGYLINKSGKVSKEAQNFIEYIKKKLL